MDQDAKVQYICDSIELHKRILSKKLDAVQHKVSFESNKKRIKNNHNQYKRKFILGYNNIS